MPDDLTNSMIFIAGPTASGKTALAVSLASRIDAEIVNADSMQVYADLPILSAQPGDEERAAATHHLFGHVDGEVRYSVGSWLEDVALALNEIRSRGRTAVIVGGTGLYFAGLEKGLAPMPVVPPEILSAGQALIDEIGLEAFREGVIEKDPMLERLEPNDMQRHLRAWSVMEVSGARFSDLQKATGKGVRAQAIIELMPEREKLYAACERRFDEIIDQGAIDEARQLAARGLSSDLPVMRAVGAVELMAHIDGVLSLPEAAELAKRNTRHLAKRQMTWFRNQADDWPVAETAQDALKTLLNSI